MVETGKQSTSGGSLRSPPNEEQRGPGSPNQTRSADSAEICAAQLEAVIESVGEAVVVCDADGRPVRMNRRARELFDCDSIEHAWRSVSEIADVFELHTLEGSPIALEDRPLSRAIRGETFRDVEVHAHSRRTGNEWVFRCSGMPIRDPQGNVVLAVLTLHKAEETLEMLRQRDPELSSVLRAAPLGIGLVMNRVILDVNDWLCEMVGYRREELIGRNSRMLYLTQDDWERVGRENYGQIHRRSKGVLETRWRRKNGDAIDVLLSSTLLDRRNPSRGVTFTALDITARKKAEDELRNVFSLSLDMICIADLRTDTFTKVNPAFERILGYSEQELLSRPFMEFVHPDDLKRAQEILEESLHQGKRVVHFENRFRCKDGSYRWLDWTAHPRPEQGLTYGIARDVTEQKRMEDALRFTQFAIDHSADAAFWMTKDARFFYVNEAACRALGYSCDELLKKTVYDIDPTFTEKIWSDSWRTLKAKKSNILETVHQARDGRIYPVEIRANYVEFGGREYDCAFARDITERKRAEEALRESEERFRTAFEAGAVAMALTAMDTTLLKVNPSFCRMLGFSESELVGRSFIEITHPDDVAANLVGSRRLANGEISVFRIEKRYIRKDDAVVWADMNTASVPDAQGRPLYCVTHIQDITQRKLAEEALRESEERHRFLVESVNDWIWETDRNGVYTYASPQCREMLGYEPQEIVGKTPFDLMPPNEAGRMREAFTSFAGQVKPFRRLENANRRKDGRLVVMETNGVPVLDAQGKLAGYRGIDRDITERKQAEETLRQRERQLQESERKLRTLMGNLPGIAYRCANEPDWPFEFVSEGSLALTGYAPGEISGHGCVAYGDLIHPDDRRRVWDAVQRAVSRDVPFEMEYRIRTKDGSEKWVFERGRAVASPDGGPPFLEGFIADITERKRMTQALEEKEYLLSESQRMGHIGTWSFELASGDVRWTRETYRLYGISPDAFVPSAETLLDLLHPDDRGRMREWIRSALANEQPGNLEFRVVLPDGSTRILNGRGEIIFGEDGRPVRLVGTVQDITEQKQAELALRELSRKDEEALRVARMGHWEFDVATGAFIFNDQYYTLHGITAREAGGYRMTAEEFTRKYVPPEDAPVVHDSIRKAVATDDPNYQFQIEARILRADGQARWVTVWFRAEKDAAGRTVKLYGVNQDITERRTAEEALRRLNERLETLVAQRTEDLTRTVNRLQQLTWELSQTEDRERKRIADILHDDVQQTLAAARFHLNLLSTGTRSPEESREILGQVKQMLKEAIERARNLSHELSPVLYQVDLAEMLRWLARHMHEKHGLTVQVEARGSVESSSECVKALLYKVTQELLFNVVKHSGVKEALIRVRRMGRYICLVVIDRGRGFETQELEKTAGFGLLGIRERIQLLGGRMKIRSKPGMGSRLVIAIPDEGPTPAPTQAE